MLNYTLPILIVFTASLAACSVANRGIKNNDHDTVLDKGGNSYTVKRMADGKYWTTENMKAVMPGSYCYDSVSADCQRYGRLYTWKTAMTVCSQLGKGWKLPTEDEWRMLAKPYGGVWHDSNDEGKAAFISLIDGGPSQFNAVLGGGRDPDGSYKRIDGHGFYWTTTETSDATAWFYNFGRRQLLNRHNDGEKVRAFSVRCVRE
jgi:uncharacterized protein (TIGR02145 family)